MKNVDTDIAAMLQNLKKYDSLSQSKKLTENIEVQQDVAEGTGRYEESVSMDQPDQEIMEWMNRFNRLG